MIPMLILYTLSKFKAGQSILEKLLKFKKHIKKAIAVLFLLAFISKYRSYTIAPLEFTILTKQSFQSVIEKKVQYDLNHCIIKISTIN